MSESATRPEFQRLSVNINAESAAILRKVMVERDISVTEAVRQALGLLGYFAEAARLNEEARRQGPTDEELEDEARQQAWEQYWSGLTPEERQHELKLMDEHVAMWDEHGEPREGQR